jgi:hypothetical protein
MLGAAAVCAITAAPVNLCHLIGRPGSCNTRGGGVGMNKVASTTWISILVLVAIVVTALLLYNN